MIRQCMRLTSVNVVLAELGYAAASLGMIALPRYLNGSILYLPTLAALVAMACFHYGSKQPEKWLMPLAAMLFCLALLFRTMDGLWCGSIPWGTHFLWHLINGATFYVVMRVSVLTRVAARRSADPT